MSPELEQTLAVAEWLIDQADVCRRRRNVEAALSCVGFASRVLSRQNRILTHPRIERLLKDIAQESFAADQPWQPAPGAGVVHVLTNALAHGGHTAMAVRWMHADARPGVHSAALTAQRVPVPDALRRETTARGGQVFEAPRNAGALDRARWLRDLVRREARLVVLHVDMDDVASIVAFAAGDGPPVLIVNHAGHIYWTGASVADLILNCRSSAYEVEWSRLYRAPRSGILPIPLVEPAADGASRDTFRREWRTRQGLDADAVVLLAVGDTYKFTPLPRYGLDYRDSARRILARVPRAHLFVVGARSDAGWDLVARETGGRLHVMGRQPDVFPYYRAADACLESFPFGSTTSLFEAGLSGLPVVLAPATAPPPFGTDGIAVDGVLERPESVPAFEDAAVRIASDDAERRRVAERFGAAIRAHHLGEGWNRHLEAAEAALPARHGSYQDSTGLSTPPAIHEFWTAMREECWKADWPDMSAHQLPQFYVRVLANAGLRPCLPKTLLRASAGVAEARRGQGVPLVLLRAFTNGVQPWLGDTRSHAMLTSLETLFRPGSRTSMWGRRFIPASWW